MIGWLFSLLYRACNGDPGTEECHGGEQWAEKVARHMKWKLGHIHELTNERRHPDWLFYRRNDYGITAFHLRFNVLSLLATGQPRLEETVLDGGDSYLVKSGSLENTIDKTTFAKLSKLLKAYGVNVNALTSLQQDSVLVLPTESHLICAVGNGLIAIRTEGGFRSFQHAKFLLSQRHQKEAAILHSSCRFHWRKRLDDERYEQLALDLLNRESGVRWVRRVGASRASDGGRDLIAEWLMPPEPWEAATEKQALIHRRIVVQCKAYTNAISRADIGDAVGTVDLHDADGYLLIAHPRVTPAAIDYLTKVPPKRKIWADWWTQGEVEERLRRNLDISSRYPDLVEVESSQ